MPKLSQYLIQQGAAAPSNGINRVEQAAQALPLSGNREASSRPLELQKPLQEVPLSPLDQQLSPSSQKLRDAYAKRVKEHGPRLFRWPDGSLQTSKPPPNPYAVANRRKWAPLVQHCRTNGGDRAFEATGKSLRYGINVTHQQHAEYLQLVGLEPETNEKGEYIGYNPTKTAPLKDPEHALNSFYKTAADAVFKDARGRLL